MEDIHDTLDTENKNSLLPKPDKLPDKDLKPGDSKNESNEKIKAVFQAKNEESSLRPASFESLESKSKSFESPSESFESVSGSFDSISGSFGSVSESLESSSRSFKSSSKSFDSISGSFKSVSGSLESASGTFESRSAAFESIFRAFESVFVSFKSVCVSFGSDFLAFESASGTLKSSLESFKSVFQRLESIFPAFESVSKAFESTSHNPGSAPQHLEVSLLKFNSSIRTFNLTLPDLESILPELDCVLKKLKAAFDLLQSNFQFLISSSGLGNDFLKTASISENKKETLPFRNKCKLVFINDNTASDFELAKEYDPDHYHKERAGAKVFLKALNNLRELCNTKLGVNLKQCYSVFRAVKALFPAKRFVFEKELKMAALLLYINKKTRVTRTEFEEDLPYSASWRQKLMKLSKRKGLVGYHRSRKGNYYYISQEGRKFVEAALEMKELK